MAVLLALAAGLGYAVASVMQHRAARRQPDELVLRPTLLLRLFRDRLWLVGLVVDTAAFGLEIAALHFGHVTLVAPLLVSGLLFVFPLSAAFGGPTARARDWCAMVAVTVGLTAFVVIAQPHGGIPASTVVWIAAIVVVGAAATVSVVVGLRIQGARRALAFGIATGLVYGVTAVLTKSVVDQFGTGLTHVLGDWRLYALVAISAIAMLTNQSAFQAGHVAAALPAISVVNPVVACALGVLLLGEGIRARSAPVTAIAVLAVAVMTVGTIVLARSPTVGSDGSHGVRDAGQRSGPSLNASSASTCAATATAPGACAATTVQPSGDSPMHAEPLAT